MYSSVFMLSNTAKQGSRSLRSLLGYKMYRLIVTADDMGYCRERNRGIVDAFLRNGVSRASLLVGGQAAEEAVRLAREHGITLGLHFNVTEGRPILPEKQIPTLLTADHLFRGKMGFRNALNDGKVDLCQVKMELESQIDRFISLTGYTPCHVDGHQHVHVLPGVCEVFAFVLNDRGIFSTRLPVDPALEGVSWLPPTQKQFLRQVVHDAEVAARCFRKHRIRFPDGFIGLTTMGAAMSSDRLQQAFHKVLEILQDGRQYGQPNQLADDQGSPVCQHTGGIGEEFSLPVGKEDTSEGREYFPLHNQTCQEADRNEDVTARAGDSTHDRQCRSLPNNGFQDSQESVKADREIEYENTDYKQHDDERSVPQLDLSERGHLSMYPRPGSRDANPCLSKSHTGRTGRESSILPPADSEDSANMPIDCDSRTTFNLNSEKPGTTEEAAWSAQPVTTEQSLQTEDMSHRRCRSSFCLTPRGLQHWTLELMAHPGYPCTDPEAGCGAGPDDFAQSADRQHEIDVLTGSAWSNFRRLARIRLCTNLTLMTLSRSFW